MFKHQSQNRLRSPVSEGSFDSWCLTPFSTINGLRGRKLTLFNYQSLKHGHDGMIQQTIQTEDVFHTYQANENIVQNIILSE